MKTNFRNFGIALFLSLATIGVNATELNKTIEIEPAMVLEDWMLDNALFETRKDNSGVKIATDIPVSNPDFSILVEAVSIETEPAMELESWMTDEGVFETKKDDSGVNIATDIPVSNPDFSILVKSVSIETEPAMELESWMTDEAVFETRNENKCPAKQR